MIEMTLSSRHMIRNSSLGGLRPSPLPFGHGGSPQYWLSHVDGEETCFFVSFKPPRPGTNNQILLQPLQSSIYWLIIVVYMAIFWSGKPVFPTARSKTGARYGLPDGKMGKPSKPHYFLPYVPAPNNVTEIIKYVFV